MLGGEERVVELLEDESKKSLKKPLLEGADENPQPQQRTFWNFFCQPDVLGEDLLTIEKFGLVQYVSCGSSYWYVYVKHYRFLHRGSSDDFEDTLRIYSTCFGTLWRIW